MRGRAVLSAWLAVAPLALVGESYRGEADIGRIVTEALGKDQTPGAVVEVGGARGPVFRKAYGSRALVPAREAMTEDTIFDAASLTKVVATTSSLMKLVERGLVRIDDPVTVYLPGFQNGKSDITVRQLMTHYSGLRPDLDLEPAWSGYDTGIAKALADKPVAKPGERFIYSDINFILLGEIVRQRSGARVDQFAYEQVFQPLGMKDTLYTPPEAWRPRIAPTEKENGMAEPLRGVVHDPTTRFMDGVAGHAGMFTTAGDLGRWARMILNGGLLEGARLVNAATVARFTEPSSPEGMRDIRGLGFDIASRYSANRGELFPLGSFGHTGFTGTSMWIDPSSKTYVLLMSNSVHPRRRPPLTSLRSRVATIAAAHSGANLPRSILARPPKPRFARVSTGLDVLTERAFAQLKGKRVGLITNHTGINRDGLRNVDLMLRAGVRVAGLLSPEHGIAGTEDHENVADGVDAKTKIPIHSLYRNKDRRPPQALLKQFDVVVFDIQDVGARFYTYMCTMLYAMEESAKARIPFVVLDRPNPITGTHVEGPMIDDDVHSFVGCLPIPLRHGMTMGELAAMANAEQKIGANLEVVKMRGWLRSDWLDSTGLTWVNPSPNMRSLTGATLYPGIGMLEYTKSYSVGRWTDGPFEQIGAPWINGPALAEYLSRREIPGVRFYATVFAPNGDPLNGQTCRGVRFVVTDREELDATRLGLELAGALLKLFPGKVDLTANAKLIGRKAVIGKLAAGEDPAAVARWMRAETVRFLEVRAKYLLY
ncbi:MAG: DUF1343 domain-containing protein [Bryobacteraceae bacterium]